MRINAINSYYNSNLNNVKNINQNNKINTKVTNYTQATGNDISFGGGFSKFKMLVLSLLTSLGLNSCGPELPTAAAKLTGLDKAVVHIDDVGGVKVGVIADSIKATVINAEGFEEEKMFYPVRFSDGTVFQKSNITKGIGLFDNSIWAETFAYFNSDKNLAKTIEAKSPSNNPTKGSELMKKIQILDTNDNIEYTQKVNVNSQTSFFSKMHDIASSRCSSNDGPYVKIVQIDALGRPQQPLRGATLYIDGKTVQVHEFKKWADSQGKN